MTAGSDMGASFIGAGPGAGFAILGYVICFSRGIGIYTSWIHGSIFVHGCAAVRATKARFEWRGWGGTFSRLSGETGGGGGL